MAEVLPVYWYVIIAVLWLGYLALEGFDLGVGMLVRFWARDEPRRRVLLNIIGPVWEGNEVWLITAVGAMFAAFPFWYAAVFSTLYLPMLVMLFGLILRAVSIEYRGKGHTQRWLTFWTWAMAIGSTVTAFLIGVPVTMLAAYLPARKAGRVAPVQAMGDEPAMPKESAIRTLVIGSVLTALGVVGMVLGLFTDISNPVIYLGLGILLVMLGVAVVSPVFGRPFIVAIGGLYRAVFGQVGTMAERNSVRNPGRTAATASALRSQESSTRASKLSARQPCWGPPPTLALWRTSWPPSTAPRSW